MSKRRNWLLLAGLLILANLLVGCAGQPKAPAAGLKLAMILPGPIADEDYNQIGFQAIRQLAKSKGLAIAYAEKVPVPDSERVAREYINEGYTAVAFHGGQFVAIGTKLAKEFPNVTFVLETSGQIADQPANVWNIARKFYQGAYPLGVLAAQATRSGKIGILGATAMQDTIERINAVQQAVAKTNGSAQVGYVLTGDANDTVAAHDATAAMIAGGVDFVVDFLNGGTFGVEQAVGEARTPVLMTTYYTDKSQRASQSYTTSLLVDFYTPYAYVMDQITAGKRSGYYEMVPGAGLQLAAINNVPAAARSAAAAAFSDIQAKKLQINIDSKNLFDKQG